MVRNQELKYHPPKKLEADNSAADLFWEWVHANRDFKKDPGVSFLLLMESCELFFLGQNHLKRIGRKLRSKE